METNTCHKIYGWHGYTGCCVEFSALKECDKCKFFFCSGHIHTCHSCWKILCSNCMNQDEQWHSIFSFDHKGKCFKCKKTFCSKCCSIYIHLYCKKCRLETTGEKRVPLRHIGYGGTFLK